MNRLPCAILAAAVGLLSASSCANAGQDGTSDDLACGSDGCWIDGECRGGSLEDYCEGPCPTLEDAAVTGACGQYRWINRFQNSLDSLLEYYDAEGVLVGVEHWTDCNCFCDGRSFFKAFGSVPDCEREPPPPAGANVVAVSATGDSGAYTFTVTLRSPDTGCDQYADWWEVITPTGELIYRRVLTHSHVDEQPFTRSGGPVEVQPSTRVVVRGHMNTTGYSGLAFSGSVETGFGVDNLVTGELAPGLAHETPLPSGCAF